VTPLGTPRTSLMLTITPAGQIWAIGGFDSTSQQLPIVEAYGPVFNVPGSATGGSMTTVSGTNFAPNASVTVKFGAAGTPVGMATTDGSGAFSTTFMVPPGAGPQKVVASDGKSQYPISATLNVL
jgi:hypothetical protein